MYRSHVLICGGTGCTSSGSAAIEKALVSEIEKNGLKEEVQVVKTGCFGLCALGPIMIVYPEGTFYSMVKVDVYKRQPLSPPDQRNDSLYNTLISTLTDSTD